MIRLSFKDRLKEARKAKGLKQIELSIKCGLSKNAVSNYETGVSFPPIETLYKIFDILDTEPNFLFQDDVKFNNITLSLKEKIMIKNLRELNALGQNKACEYIKDLSTIPNYTITYKAHDEIEAVAFHSSETINDIDEDDEEIKHT